MTPLSARVEGNHWTIPLPYTSIPISLNDRDHWAVKARKVREVRDAVTWIARAGRFPKGLSHMTVQLHYTPAQKRRRDQINASATSKACVDALVAYGAVEDDSAEWVTDLMPVFHLPGTPAVWLEIEVTP